LTGLSPYQAQRQAAAGKVRVKCVPGVPMRYSREDAEQLAREIKDGMLIR
jgi:hypothetical protein